MQIRRSASIISTGELGFVIGALQKKSADENETMVLVFEGIVSGLVSEQAIEAVHLTDGSPADLAELP